jgi:hypothetical protein
LGFPPTHFWPNRLVLRTLNPGTARYFNRRVSAPLACAR